MPRISTDEGVSIYFEVQGAGPIELILLHGMGGSTATWQAVLPHLAPAECRVLTLDFRGHGCSKADPETFSMRSFSADVQRAAEAAGMTSAIVVGFSGSTKNAVWLAAHDPVLVRALVLVAPPGLGSVPMPREILWPFFEQLTRTKIAPAEFEPWLTPKLGKFRETVVAEYANTPRAVLEAAAEIWFYESVEAEAARVVQPTLVVAGGREPLANEAYQAATTCAALPHARLEMLDCGYWIPFEEPAALARLLLGFARAHPEGDRQR
jgi:pimeloyl-ACP methyl ester carboxylesterase